MSISIYSFSNCDIVGRPLFCVCIMICFRYCFLHELCIADMRNCPGNLGVFRGTIRSFGAVVGNGILSSYTNSILNAIGKTPWNMILCILTCINIFLGILISPIFHVQLEH